jgi:carboxylesterase type B
VLTDGLFSCTANISNEIFSLSVPTYGYQFDDENAPTPELPRVSFPYGATHTDELQFLFTLASTPQRFEQRRIKSGGGHAKLLEQLCAQRYAELAADAAVGTIQHRSRQYTVPQYTAPWGGIRIRGAASLQLLDRRVGTNCSRDQANVCRDMQ